MKLGASYQIFDLVFASEIGTPLLHGNLLRRHFKPIRDKAKLPKIRLYDLRHTTATLLLSAGETRKSYQKGLDTLLSFLRSTLTATSCRQCKNSNTKN
jgi:integrase